MMVSHSLDLTGAQWSKLIGWFREHGPQSVKDELTLSELYFKIGADLKIQPRNLLDADYTPLIEAAHHAKFHFPDPAAGEPNSVIIQGRVSFCCNGQNIIKAIRSN